MRAFFLGLLGPLILLGAPPAASQEPGRLEGVVRFSGEGAGPARVEVHLGPRSLVRTPPFAAVQSAVNGSFTLELPPGTYYLSAMEEGTPGPPRVSEYAGNPVTLGEGDTLALEPITLGGEGMKAEAAPAGGITGVVVFQGEPVPDAHIMVYDGEAIRLVGPRFVQSALSGANGAFDAPLPPGTYRVAVRKRRRGTAFGPPQPGDLSAEYQGNPVAVAAEKNVDLGTIPLHRVDLQRLEGEMEDLDNPAPGTTLIAGKVEGPDGKPLAGQFVFLYENPQMQGRPVGVTRSGEGGKFSLTPLRGGRYYVIARSRYGTTRQPGDLLGLVADMPDSSVTVEEGDRATGLLLRMEQVW